MDFADTLRIRDAIAWAGRVQDDSFEDWEAHGQWLQSDDRNPVAYARAVLAIEDGTAQLRERAANVHEVANDNFIGTAVKRHGATFLGISTLSAACAALFLFSPAHTPSPVLVSVLGGQTRTVNLSDGTSLTLNGNTRLRIDGPRRVTLQRGEVYASVRHYERQPFELVAGGKVYRDVGTAFNAVVAGPIVRLEVGEGVVLYDPGGAAVALEAGRGVTVSGGVASFRTFSPGSVGSWRKGRLVYRNAGMSEVAEDLGRSLRYPITVSPDARRRHFSGIIAVSPTLSSDAQGIGRLLGVEVKVKDDRWYFDLPQ